MAYLVERSDGRYELRESVNTPRGPRSRTLAIFSELSEAVLDRAGERAAAPLDRRTLLRRARERGVPWLGPDSAPAALELIAATRTGRPPPAAFAAALREVFSGEGAELPDSVAPLLDWIGVGDEPRGRALSDALRLADRLRRSRPRRVGDLTYPSVCST